MLTLFQPQRAIEVISRLLPANLDFYRTPITAQPVRLSPSIPATSAISAAAVEGNTTEVANKTSIHGSVSTLDITANLKAILAESEEGSRVVLLPEDISFVEAMEEKDRVKHLGVFEIEITLKGATDVVRRTIKVSAQD